MFTKKQLAKLFGKGVYVYRQRYNLSLKEMGYQLGRTPAQVIEIEEGKVEEKITEGLKLGIELLCIDYVVSALKEANQEPAEEIEIEIKGKDINDKNFEENLNNKIDKAFENLAEKKKKAGLPVPHLRKIIIEGEKRNGNNGMQSNT